jgi:hypothetical protein
MRGLSQPLESMLVPGDFLWILSAVEFLPYKTFYSVDIRQCSFLLWYYHVYGRVTCKTGSGLDDGIYWHFMHSTRDTGNCSAIAVLHTFQFTFTLTLGFSVFTSYILATDLSQTQCNFKSDLKTCHSLISSFPSLLNHLRLPSPKLYLILFPAAWDPRYIAPGGPHGKHRLIVKERVYSSVA